MQSMESHPGTSQEIYYENYSQVENDKEEEEKEEVLIEPRFKYSRILNDLPKLLEKDGASCLAIHDKFIAVGCQSGRICIFDYLGNANMQSIARHHNCTVTCISIDNSGEYLASCANDFSVSIFGIGCDEYNQKVSLRYSARSLAIATDFSTSGSGQKFVVGERDLILFERSFLGRRKSTVLYQGKERDGLITAISWHGHYLAFTNESGTRIYDFTIARTITLVQPLHKMEMYYSFKFQPRHVWLNSRTLAIGWANTVCVCEITAKKSEKGTFKQGKLIYRWIIPDFYIGGVSYTPHVENEITATTSNYIKTDNSSGISEQTSVGNASSNLDCLENRTPGRESWREIVIFGIHFSNSDNDDKFNESRSCLSDSSTMTTMTTAMLDSTSNFPSCTQLILLQPLNIDEYQLIAEETIEMRHVELKNIGRFLLGALPCDNLYFMQGPRELIKAHPCSVNDRINWLIENELYYEAFNFALCNRELLRETTVMDIGRHLIKHLINNRDYDTAARFLPQICSGQKQEWEYYVGEFEKARRILKLVPVIPVSNPQLEPECYESILTVALYSAPNLFLALILQWNADLYRVGFIRDKTIARMADRGTLSFSDNDSSSNVSSSPTSTQLSKDEVICLYKVLAHLYLYERDFKRALEIYLLLRDPSIFGIIERYNVFSFVQNRVVELMEINTDLTIRLLLDNENSLLSKSVVTSLNNHPKLQIAYLNKLFNRGEGSEYSDLMVRLYAEHDRQKLLPFLRKSEHYRIDKALNVCRQHNLVEENIFLLGRSGNRMEALEQIILNLNRIELAIEFCKEHGEADEELWDRLIELGMKKPEHILVLLSAIGTLIDDPLKVISKIPSDMQIPGLSEAIKRIFGDLMSQQYIYEDFLLISINDLNDSLHEFVTPSSVSVNLTMDICTSCSKFLANDNGFTNNNEEIILFSCGHKFHQKCYRRITHESADALTSPAINNGCTLCLKTIR